MMSIDSPQHPRRTAGFTLIEILLVLAVVGILVSVAMPRINLDRFRIDSGVHTVASAIAASRSQAILQQHDMVLIFDEANREFRVLTDANNNGVADSGESLRTVDLEDGVTYGRGGAKKLTSDDGNVTFELKIGGLPALRFHRNGSASEEGVIYITSMRAAQGSSFPEDTRALKIERSTGRVTCYTYRTLSWEEGC